MTTASFPKFTRLPPEIQQQIWMLAAEDTRGAHFFTYIDDDKESQITCRNQLQRTTNYGPYLALAVPADNRSIIRTAKQKHKDDFVLGTYQDKGITRNVIVRSETDLIILCPTDMAKLRWDRVRTGCPPSIRHLALEYDPSWPQFGQGPPPLSEKGKAACECLAWIASTQCTWQRLVWFIDYSLKRRPDANGDLDEYRDEFWCATGRFVEVWDDDEDWVTGPEDGVHKLVASLKEDREKRLRLEEDLEEMGIQLPCGCPIKVPPPEPENPDDTDEMEEYGFQEFDRGPILGVLAFEPW